ncbi:plasmid partitioning protein RepA [Methylobacterium sp. C25]|uniref:plasmid partitioning protein RepA n=1 Tax=Methylobacterium sp. C25 TaxID=2721622 RepID=UPI001F36B1A8|nr:plasmid partitioning protein RepA [Methylobacterium sp. C25]MCE4226319.1 plasmid partitioning protein RepA [Methylobacterium sp. C25]
MNQRAVVASPAERAIEAPGALIGQDAATLRSRLQSISSGLFPPDAAKTLRRFAASEAAKILGVTVQRLSQLEGDEAVPDPEISNTGRRSYSLDDIHAIRLHLDKVTKTDRRYDPCREDGEHLQVISVVNFKGGSGKTTTAAHLAQSLALRGYRVLAIDLDPQASLSALLGVQPEIDVAPNQTLYAAIRYDNERRALSEVIRKTYFAGLDLIPANLELQDFEFDTPRALTSRKPGEPLFFERMARALDEVEADYDVVVVDCPPQLGYLTLSALSAATALLVTVHPQMLDVASMSQFLAMVEDLLSVISEQGATLSYDWISYLITRYEPQDGPQTQVVGMLRDLFGDRVLTSPMLKSSAVSDAGLSKQTLYEMGRTGVTRSTYDRALEALDLVNGEIETKMQRGWGRA